MKLQEFQKSVADISLYFVYASDPKWIIDPWYVMKPIKGHYVGDCDDFALTTVYKVLGFWGIIFHTLFTKKIRFVRCETYTGEFHVYAKYTDNNANEFCWDNWSRKVMPIEEFKNFTKHKDLKTYNTFQICVKMLSGLFLSIKRNK
jgi:predicted transglutaminase-like cysteine proteinase